MNHFCYNSLFGFSEKELEKMENNHRIVVDGDLIDSAKAYEDIMQSDVFRHISCRFVPEGDVKNKRGIRIYDNVDVYKRQENIPLNTLERFAAVLGVSPAYLAGWTDATSGASKMDVQVKSPTLLCAACPICGSVKFGPKHDNVYGPEVCCFDCGTSFRLDTEDVYKRQNPTRQRRCALPSIAATG